jgi:hypothetical protein
MTTPQHAMQSIMISYSISMLLGFSPFWMGVHITLAVILGTISDIGRLFQINIWDWDDVYLKLHRINIFVLLIPYYNLHVFQDYFMHDQINGGWKTWVSKAEILAWLIEIFIIYYWVIK